MMSLLSGCVKDNSNINGLILQNPGIGFPYGANNKNDFIIRPSASTQQVLGLLLVTLEAVAPASSDIHVTIADNSTTLVNTYNTANGTSIQPFPGSLWSIPSELIIKSGDRYTLEDITINSTTGLNLNLQYAIGISIAGASGGNKIADNLKNLFIVFRIQNELDGKFRMKGEFYHYMREPSFTPHDFAIELQTIAPYSNRLYWPLSSGYDNGYNGYGYNTPYTTNGGVPTWGHFYGLHLSRNPFNPNNNPNDITAFHQPPPGATWNIYPLDSCNGKTYHNRWDPATNIIYLAMGLNLGYNVSAQTRYFVPGQSIAWIDTLTYLGPR